MATKILTTEQYRALDKTGWHQAIVKWNRTKGYTKKIPHAVGVRTSYMSPADERATIKKRKADAKKSIAYVADLVWDEVPQRLPYVFGRNDSKLDPNMVYVDEAFLEIVSKAERKPTKS